MYRTPALRAPGPALLCLDFSEKFDSVIVRSD